jgi:hypothetical protein
MFKVDYFLKSKGDFKIEVEGGRNLGRCWGRRWEEAGDLTIDFPKSK